MSVNPQSAEAVRIIRETTIVAEIIKNRFPNLSTKETIKIAGEIIIALDESIDL